MIREQLMSDYVDGIILDVHQQQLSGKENNSLIRSHSNIIKSSDTRDFFNQSSNNSHVTCQLCLVPSISGPVKPGLANNMWMYASAYGIARRNGMHLKLRQSFDISSAYQLDVKPSLTDEEFYTVNWKIVSDLDVQEPCCRWMMFDETIYNISSVSRDYSNVRLDGYFQSWRYFSDYESDIRRQFSFNDDVREKVRQFLHGALHSLKNTTNSTTVAPATPVNTLISLPVYIGIHVRLGDWQHDNLTALQTYIQDAMHYFALNFSSIVFVVCSNDIQWCRKHVTLDSQLAINNTVLYSDSSDRVLDMAILSKCNHSIITMGTYGWWSAFLAGGTTLYYHRSPLKIGRSVLTTNESHFFYPGWIPF